MLGETSFMAGEIVSYIGLGSNLGDQKNRLAEAVSRIGKISHVRLGRCSRTYFTEPLGIKNQPWFANQVLQLYCPKSLHPLDLLTSLQQIESSLGRVRFLRNGPRTIDLDLLLLGSTTFVSQALTLPHPRMKKRAFVLVPLLEITPDLVLPDGQSARQALELISYRQEGDRIWQDEPGAGSRNREIPLC